jgi:hypothetical protein
MPPRRFSAPSPLVVGAGLLLSLVVALSAQVRVPEGWGGGRFQREMVPQQREGFMFCRLMYTRMRHEPSGRGWDTDYPMGDRNLMLRLGEFTTAGINMYEDGEPAHAVVQASDPELFLCPFLFGSDIGSGGFDDEEVAALREYLLKGGFLWVDDFWGDRAMNNWLLELQRILPGHERVILENDHPLYSTFYFFEQVPQIPNIGFWRRSGGETSEFGAATEQATISGIHDDRGRLAVLMTHNTDIADGWEREAEDFAFFHRFSPPAYAVGINVAIFAMTR